MSRIHATQALIGQVQQMNAVATQMNQAAAHRIGVNQLDLQVIQLLRTSDRPTTASDLARATGISTAAATGLVDRLQNAGYVTRVPDPADRRRTTVQLSREQVATNIGPSFSPLLQRWGKALAAYSEAELVAATEILSRMTDLIHEEVSALRRPAGP